MTDSLGNQSTYASGLIGGKRYVTDSTGTGCSSCTLRGASHKALDDNGNTVSSVDALGHTTYYSYDSDGNITSESVQVDLGTYATTTYTYNSFGQVMTVTDALGNTTRNAYDSRGNLISVSFPPPGGGMAQSVTQFSYDAKGELIQITDPLGRITRMTYTSAGLISSITDPQQNVTQYEYDLRGNRTAVVDAMQNRTSFTYDVGDRLLLIRYPDGTTTGFSYDYRGRRTSVTDQNGRTTAYAYDDADRLMAVTDAAGSMTQYVYDTENNLLSITDAMGRTTSFTYDAYGRATQTRFPSTLTEGYAYDALGNLTSKTDRKGQNISYVYDALNRLTHKGYPDSSGVDYVYDLVGKIRQVTDPSGTYTFAYDNMGRLTGTTTQYSFLVGRTFTNGYSYDAASNRQSFTAPDSSTNIYSYDSLNRLSGLTNSWAGHFGFNYDRLSRLTQLTRPNNVNTSYQYDSASRLLTVLHRVGAAVVDGAAYSNDNAGNRTSKQNLQNGVSENYTYDLVYQLTQVVKGGSVSEGYSYDLVGNRLASLGLSPYQYNSSNQLTSVPGFSYTYDNNGNTTSKADSNGTTTYTWNFENRLASLALPASGGTVTFGYDPFGRRIQKSSLAGSRIYVYDGANMVLELDSGNTVATYAQGAGIDQPLAMSRSGVTVYYQADGLGSVTSLTNGSGTSLATYTYDSFGKRIASTGSIRNPFQYTGREWDHETSLYYYRARYYDPTIGRFISEDPLGFDGDGPNFYTYVLNSPVNFTDPFGLTCTYSQRTGSMVCVDDNTGQTYYNNQGYAGTGNGRNNPDAQNQQGVGPLPQGEYQLTGNWHNSPNTGQNTMNLRPRDPRHNPCTGTNRDCNSFRIHGNNRRNDASHGCIVLPPDRTRIHAGETVIVTQ